MHPLLALAMLSTAQPAPNWLAGDWEPYSNAFIGLHMLSVGKNTLSWKGCVNAGFDIVDSSDNSVTIRLAKGSTCALDDAPPTRMDTVRFTLRENRCDLGVTVYASPDAAKRNEPSAEGLYGKSKCPSGPASQAAANLSTTTR
ncbi:hypothetical protein BJI69_15530 [Luteibacter rhizovicinus DSM 16549]|uniref:DUF3617 domain-containing protein n=1 Tax=Luteibacter rhizovicinus DSM 16549 TaxID=1440763 RepID=A0A1L3EVX7_9GAMM|nr:hypothetical protein [Luteibacter rhizovicinus]APG05170.1 hypothetical protein BJI69_15530 [Luteibacter rhizovicinus DSM 16549]